MVKNTGYAPQTKTINILLMNGGVGDHVASLTAIDYIQKHYPWITPLVWTPDFLKDLAIHLLKPGTSVYSYSEMKGRYQPTRATKTTEWDQVVSPMKIHCLDYAFLKLTDENPSLEHKNYLQIRPDEIDVSHFVLPEKYIVLTTGYTAKVREFPAKTINAVSNWAKSNNLGVVFLGQKQTKTGARHVIEGVFNEEIDFSLGLDLIDKTTLLQAAKVMGGAKAVVGVDNGLMHLAGCTPTAIVGGFTTVHPDIRMPVRNNVLGHNFFPIVPDQGLDCRFCQQKTNFLYGHDYTKCLRGNDIKCVEQMTPEKFIKGLENAIK